MMIQFINKQNVEEILFEMPGKLDSCKTATCDYYFVSFHFNTVEATYDNKLQN